MLYGPIWKQIKLTTCAEVTVHVNKVATLIQGVKRTKAAENATRSMVGLIPWSRLVITKEKLSASHVKVTFKLFYDTRL